MIWKELIVVWFEILSYILSGFADSGGSSVGIVRLRTKATEFSYILSGGTGLNDLGIGVRFPAGARDASPLQIVHTDSGVQWAFPKDKVAGAWSWPVSSSSEVNTA
jgi:hypothetical protein